VKTVHVFFTSFNDSKKGMQKKEKKPLWPVWVTVVLVCCCAAVLFHDWKRYPTAVEIARYLKASDSDVEKVEVSKIERGDAFKEEALDDREAQIYHLKYTFKDGNTADEVFLIRRRDRKEVFPWHDYYSGRYFE
jgi:hypothetical protein